MRTSVLCHRIVKRKKWRQCLDVTNERVARYLATSPEDVLGFLGCGTVEIPTKVSVVQCKRCNFQSILASLTPFYFLQHLRSLYNVLAESPDDLDALSQITDIFGDAPVTRL